MSAFAVSVIDAPNIASSSGSMDVLPDARPGAASFVSESPGALLEEVRKACAQPINVLHVAALLETAGVTDAIARRRYGFPDVFALADSLANEMQDAPAPAPPPARDIPREDWKTTLLDYGRGPMGLLPLILLGALINLYQNFGQWDNSQVLTLSISTIGSLLVTGGFVQIAARKGSGYLSQGYIRAGGRFIMQVMGVCLAVVLASAILLTWGLRSAAWFDQSDHGLLVIAYITLSCLWMFSAILSTLELLHWFVIALGVGVAAAYTGIELRGWLRLPEQTVMLVATAAGLVIMAGLIAVVIVRTLKGRAAASPVGDQRVVLAPLPHLTVNLAPYFVYGVTYSVGVLVGHAGGLIGRLPAGMTRIQGLAQSELALTLALTGYILGVGMAERTMRRFWQRVKVYQRQVSAETPGQFKAILRDFLTQERAQFTRALGVSSAVVLVAVVGAVSLSANRVLLGLAWNVTTLLIFSAGLAGYGLLAMGVFDSMFLITLSRPLYALKALGISAVTTLLVSVAAGLLVSYAFGVLGIIAGSAVFLWFTRRALGRIMRHADYYYYASF
ncbi:MAG: hypothetical protein WHX52_00820 [Anaerolineae bacterium]